MDRPGHGWTAMAVVSILYLPMAALAMGPYLLAEPEILVSQFPEGGFRQFVESALAGRAGPYQAHLVGMFSHTLTGALLMALGPYLLYSRPRRRTRAHVIAGRVYLATVLASMTGSLTFLVGERLEDAFTGPVFALSLWTLLVGTVFTAVLGWVSALQHRIRAHVLWVCLNYGYLMAAPLLRIEWGLFGAVGVGDTLEEVSPQSAIHVVMVTGTLAVLGGTLIADKLRPRTVGQATAGSVPRGVVVGSAAVGLVALGVLCARYLDHGPAATTNLAWFVVPLGLCLVGVALSSRRARDAGRAELAGEQLVLWCWLAVSPLLALPLAWLGRVVLGLDTPVADATGVTVCTGLAVSGAVYTLYVREVLSTRRERPVTGRTRTTAPGRRRASSPAA